MRGLRHDTDGHAAVVTMDHALVTLVEWMPSTTPSRTSTTCTVFSLGPHRPLSRVGQCAASTRSSIRCWPHPTAHPAVPAPSEAVTAQSRTQPAGCTEPHLSGRNGTPAGTRVRRASMDGDDLSVRAWSSGAAVHAATAASAATTRVARDMVHAVCDMHAIPPRLLICESTVLHDA
jgi:hypothetical protein